MTQIRINPISQNETQVKLLTSLKFLHVVDVELIIMWLGQFRIGYFELL